MDRESSPSKGRSRRHRAVPTLLAITALLTLAFWLVFFADYAAQPQSYFAVRCPSWFSWERSFPAADLWMAATCLIAAVGLWRGRPWGLLFALLGGSALVFLGLMDVLFFLQNGLYAPINGEVLVEAVIHLWALAFGAFVIAYTWWRRQDLLAA